MKCTQLRGYLPCDIGLLTGQNLPKTFPMAIPHIWLPVYDTWPNQVEQLPCEWCHSWEFHQSHRSRSILHFQIRNCHPLEEFEKNEFFREQTLGTVCWVVLYWTGHFAHFLSFYKHHRSSWKATLQENIILLCHTTLFFSWSGFSYFYSTPTKQKTVQNNQAEVCKTNNLELKPHRNRHLREKTMNSQRSILRNIFL